ncbi:DUF433 domain-containing protein [Sphingomonas glacialis]|uniref:DUF433 domain-containing protein n=1 Tax=Sphingomonas glacialis TaxID=658225 RepID=UPI0013870B8E|nr:DUF433 domain-containing protein [Sphingomonas glacialis]
MIEARFVAQNKPVIAGNRVSVAAIRDFANAGYSAAKIVKEYLDITVRDVEAVLSYLSESVAA